MSITKRLGIVIVTVVMGCACLATAGAQSVSTPFHLKSEGTFESGLPLFPGGTGTFQANGTASRLGKYTVEGSLTLGALSISATGEVTGSFEESLVLVAANGDQLAFSSVGGSTGTFTGQLSADGLSVIGVSFDVELSPDPALSTGRFSNVTGGSVLLVTSADAISLISNVPGFTTPFNFTDDGEGSLIFD
jgi:hypothetical protein